MTSTGGLDLREYITTGLRLTAKTVRDYVLIDPLPWPNSISAREEQQADQFAALPLSHPMKHTLLLPLQYLSSSADHLTAAAAIIDAPDTIMALFTVLRTQVAGASYAAFVGDPTIGFKERVRRMLNVELESRTEQMRLIGRTSPERIDHYDRLDQERKNIKSAAAKLGWKVVGEDTPKDKAWPKDWFVTPQDKEMNVVKALLQEQDVPNGANVTMYRYLSGVTHVQPHGLRSLIIREHSVTNGDGSALAAIGVTAQALLTLGLASVGALSVAMDRCAALYGWPVEPWQRDVVPFLSDVRTKLGVGPEPSGVVLLG